MKTLKRVLVANRGEIAVRVMRSCRERGLETVAIFSEADAAALHVQHADFAYPVGPAPAAESYLVIDKVIETCKRAGADAIHPGYGFLSENPDFADACKTAGITFIGPDSNAMRVMGTKTSAREAVSAAGTPIVPGNNGPAGKGFPDGEAALQAAQKIGFPVLLKAAAGGGGKGMRLVEKPEDLVKSFDAARREALSAFGDDRVYVEKAIIKPRHIEIQVFADSHGNCVHLGERDCSIQRRHQKVVEEAPSVAVDEKLRAQMGAAAVAAARAVDYVGAGTVEFLLSADGQFYFLEMNTRLQVEHPVTEMIHGVDLVDWQLLVADGGKLPMAQAQIDQARRGWSIECRIYAEDPVRFLPSAGPINSLVEPNGPYVRNDCGVYAGGEVSVYYDPMISKLVVWADTRERALARMRRALREYHITGIETNLSFHRALFEDSEFCQGQFDTGFLGRRHPALLKEHGTKLAVVAAATALANKRKQAESPNVKSNRQDTSRWRDLGGW